MAADSPAPGGRIALIDVARGAALIGMGLYHLSWDCADLGLVARTLPSDPPMRLFSHAVAASFLLLAGVSLALAHPRVIRWPAFWRRFALVAGAAALVSAATYLFAPDEAIWFGILHCIAFASLLALPLLAMRTWVAFAAALAAFAAPLLVKSNVFDPPWLMWTGLATPLPSTLDWRPALPWSGFVFLGLGLARLFGERFAASPAGLWSPRGAPGRTLAFAGRRSLAIYLIHQPILYGALFAAVNLSGFAERRDEAAFTRTCESECRENGGEAQRCVAACGCVVSNLRQSGLTASFSNSPLDQQQRAAYSRIVRDCIAVP